MTVDAPAKVVIIGGSFAAIAIAKQLFQDAKKSGTKIDVTLISESSKAYFNVAAPRLLVKPELIEDAFFPLEASLKSMANGESVSFVHGSVQSVDFESKTVTTQSAKKDGPEVVDYDYLIVASGASGPQAAFKLSGDHENTTKSINALAAELKLAKNIAIVGGGPTGVEAAGEIGFYYGKDAKVTLYTGDKRPLPTQEERFSVSATKKLNDLDVKVVNNVRYKSIDKVGNGSKVEFDDGSIETFDSIIIATPLKPNSGFLPDEVKDKRGFLLTDEYLRVEGHSSVYGVGDVIARGNQTIIDIDRQVGVLGPVLKNEILKANVKTKPFNGHVNALITPISEKGGVGQALGWSIPEFVIRMVKSKNYMLPQASKRLG